MRPPELPGGNTRKDALDSFKMESCFNEAAGITRRKQPYRAWAFSGRSSASMRPPELPGGNLAATVDVPHHHLASMRPPELPGGNKSRARYRPARLSICFNEAAGITRRKRAARRGSSRRGNSGFNEAAGITRRKRMVTVRFDGDPLNASMRPPELPGGNFLVIVSLCGLTLALQ